MSPRTSTSLKSAARLACSVLALAAPLLLAQPAVADNGPKTPEEAAACRGVLNTLIGGSLFGPGGVSAICAVKPTDQSGQSGAPSDQSAQSTAPRPSARGSVTYDLPKMRQEVAELRTKAATLDRLGEHEAARKTRAEADALQHRIDAIVRAEEHN
ncbi:hypothetical protein ACFVHB_37805 [Kitasatospora sp. NPDC127111]|uniref:hypothetical protein n=1 Tax=Kitasatospora sp. NPDC127111 TaxID=3345363 RepID=UPI00362FCCF3